MKTSANVRLDFEVNFILNESEVRALDALAGYGLKPFLEMFYKNLGKHYMEPYESGLESLFKKIEELRGPIAEMDEVKKAAAIVKKKFS